MFASLPIKLLDCRFHPQDVAAELMIVEGDSASTAVGITRDTSYQAVLPIQGKPLNAWKANRVKVASNEFYSAILLVRPPMFEINATHLTNILCAETDEQAVANIDQLSREGYQNITKKRFRGLASMGNAILSKYCVNPETRHDYRLRAEDAVAAIRAFSPNVTAK